MKMSKRRSRSFDPRDVATRLNEALSCDLWPLSYVYEGSGKPECFYPYRQATEFLKKFSVDDKHQLEELVKLTFDKFHTVNGHMSDYREIEGLPNKNDRIQSWTPFFQKVMLRARALMHFVLTDFDEDEWFNATKHGTGSSIGVKYHDTSLEAKWELPLTVTQRAKPLLERYLSWDFQTHEALGLKNRECQIFKIVAGSRATTVPKNNDIRRFICVEPTGNMFLQQGLMQMLYKRMKLVGLDVESLPEMHRLLAWAASIDGREATIDWSSASDCTSIGLLRWLSPPKWFGVLDMVRCSQMEIDSTWTQLNMFSTMGNADTFPLETLVFWTLAHAVKLSLEPGNSLLPEWEDIKAVSVFGDDCIVPSYMANEFIECCVRVGYIINSEKSHIDITDKFRESCGGDFLAGHNCRPFNLKAPPRQRLSDLAPWLYSSWNILLKKYKMCFGELTYVYDKELFRTFFELFQEYGIKIRIVPEDYPEDSGLQIGDELARWQTAYRFKFEPILVSKQGTCIFHYLKFQYKESEKWNEELRYVDALKRSLPHSIRPPIHEYKTRRVGGYVVAKGISCHWSVLTR